MQIRRRNPGAQHTSHCARNRYGDASNIVSVLTQRARDRSQDAHTFPRPQAHLRQTPTSPHRATRHQRHTADTHATHDVTSPTLHNGTSAMSRVSQKRTKTNNAPHTTHSHAAYKHTSPARPQDIPHSRNHCALRNHHRMHNAARTPHTARHTQFGTQLRPPHTPPTENHTQSHTRPPRHTHVRAVRLPSVDGMLPESWLLYKPNHLQDTRTAIASHHGTRRRRPQPAVPNAAHRIA